MQYRGRTYATEQSAKIRIPPGILCFVLWVVVCCVLATPPSALQPCPARGPTAGGEFEGEHAALVKVQLVLLGLADVQNFHVAALHAHRQPVLVGAVAQGEDLGGAEGRGEVRTPFRWWRTPSGGGGRSGALPPQPRARRGSWPRAWNTAGNRMSNH